MITIDHQPRRVSVAVLGEFTVGDFKEFEELACFKIKFEGPVDLLLDLRQMAGFTVDLVWEELRFSRQHASDFTRIAVLTDSQWVTWSAWVSQIFTKANVEVFGSEDAARTWLNEVAAT